MFYLFRKFPTNSKKESVFNSALLKTMLSTMNGDTFSCREYCNRHVQNHEFNFLACTYTTGFPQEFNANPEFVTKVLQTVTGKSEIFCGNRFFYCTSPIKLRSPLGSLITGIMKVITIHKKFTSKNYEDFVQELIVACVTTEDLGDFRTRSSVALCLRLFHDYPEQMPEDLSRLENTMGTKDYLYHLRGYSAIKILLNSTPSIIEVNQAVKYDIKEWLL